MYKDIKYIKKFKQNLTKQQFLTLKGQILAGDSVGAMKGLNKILRKAGDSNKK